MSKNKIGRKNIRSKLALIRECLGTDVILPVDLDEFSEACRCRRSVIVEIPPDGGCSKMARYIGAFVSLFTGYMSLNGRTTLLATGSKREDVSLAINRAFSLKGGRENLSCSHSLDSMKSTDAVIVDTFHFDVVEWFETMRDLDKSNARPFGKRKMVIFRDGYDNGVDSLLGEYPDDFKVIGYSPEKKLVDDFIRTNGTVIDPLFDLMLLDNGLCKRKVLMYLATNYVSMAREYARLSPDIVNCGFCKEDWNDLVK